jgi:predicted transcriptional regulator of viral defense system
MYVLPPPYSHPNPAFLANVMYVPSYLTAEWALNYYGLIPEKSVTFTSVTTRKPASFDNALGLFRYRHIKPDAFFGYHTVEMSGSMVMLAEPEKALLDLWHLASGAWSTARMEEMRFQNIAMVDNRRLQEYAKRFESPRLTRAACVWTAMKPEDEGSREL